MSTVRRTTSLSEDTAMLVLPLQAQAATLEVVGGKGAALSRLAAAGLPVPPGFHVTTAAYRRFVAANNLLAAIVRAAAAARADDPAALDAAAARIAALFLAGTIPAEVAAAIYRAYAELGADDPAVGVRPSAPPQ